MLGTTSPLNNHTLAVNIGEEVKVTISYNNGAARADGPFTVEFPDVSLVYSTTNTLANAKLCTLESGEAYAVGSEYKCDLDQYKGRIFYVIESSASQVTLLGTSAMENIAWLTNDDFVKVGGVVTDEMKNDNGICQYGCVCLDESVGPVTVLNALTLSVNASGWPVSATLPTAKQIANAAGNTTWDGESIITLPSWLCGSLTSGYGYWTSTSSDNEEAFAVLLNYTNGCQLTNMVKISQQFVYPTITILKK